MKTTFFITLVLFFFISFDGIGQQKSKKEIKSERELLKQKEIEYLINSQSFVFKAQNVLSQRGAMIVLDYNTYFVEFNTEKAISYLPFFGRAFSVSYGSDGGIKFEGKPENIRIEKKKKSYVLKTTVKGSDDTYDLLFSVFYDGGATLFINSNKKAAISYSGEISALHEDSAQKQKE